MTFLACQEAADTSGGAPRPVAHGGKRFLDTSGGLRFLGLPHVSLEPCRKQLVKERHKRSGDGDAQPFARL